MNPKSRSTLDFSALFAGELQFFPASSEISKLGDFARSVLEDCFGPEPLTLTAEDFRAALLKARAVLGQDIVLPYAQTILKSLRAGHQLYLDKIRLRAITPGLENVEAAAAAFFGHRDTWYGNPKCQINIWIPLHSVTANNSFRFYTDHFQATIANDSKNFQASNFREQGGFGRVDENNPSVYPRMLGQPEGTEVDIVMDGDQLLAFSAAHLHQPLPNRTSEVRFSLDFRFFRKTDLDKGLGAPDLDNESSGLLIEDYTLCDC